MGKLTIECRGADLQDKELLLQKVLAAADGFSCNVDDFETAQAMVDGGEANSLHRASFDIAE